MKDDNTISFSSQKTDSRKNKSKNDTMHKNRKFVNIKRTIATSIRL